MNHLRLYIVEKMGFGTTRRRCRIHSKPQPLLQKTCFFHAFETLVAYVGVCLCTHALAHVREPTASLVIYFQKYIFSHLKVIFPILILLMSI